MGDDIEKDANLSLVELDKGLRSNNKSDQVECVTSFSDVFDRHPFPIFINSACLKLADCFNVSNNFVRLCIVRVFQESRKHLDKVNNVDEFLARIFQVVHSNDPVARAVTIRCLAACAPVLKSRKNVHHAVLEALSSNDEVEVQASIHAVTEFSKVSQSFNRGAIETIAHKIQTASVPMKLDLIPTLQYMDASRDMTLRARLICEELLCNYVAHDMIVTILTTVTKLCCRSLTDIPKQLELLFRWLSSDVRKSVQLCVLSNLRTLLMRSPHHLTPHHVQSLLSHMESTEHVENQLSVLRILEVVASPLTAHCFTNADSDSSQHAVTRILEQFGFDLNLELSACSMKVCSKLLMALDDTEFDLYKDDIIVGIQSLILTAVSQNKQQALREGLISMKPVSESRVDSSQFLDVLLTALSTSQDECRLLICEAFMTVELPPHIVYHDLLAVLKACGDNSKVVVKLCAVILHTASHVEMGESTVSVLTEIISQLDYWSIYRVVRQALRFSQYQLVPRLVKMLIDKVTSDSALYFLYCIQSYAQSQIHLSKVTAASADDSADDLCVLDIDDLDKSIAHLTQAHNHIQTVSPSSGCRFTFHSTYLSLLSAVMTSHRRLHTVCNMYWICPPPAIGKVEGARTGDDLIRYGRITEELRKCSTETHQLYKDLIKLQQTILDADTATHDHVKNFLEKVLFTSQLIDTVLTGERQFSLPVQTGSGDTPSTGRGSAEVIESIKREWPSMTSVSDANLITITATQIESLQSASLRLLTEERLPLPRYFFQRLQTTTATINVTPHQKPGESVLVHNQSYLTLKVEGIISYTNSRPEYKRVRRVCISLSARKQSSQQDSNNYGSIRKGAKSSDIDLESTVKLSNEYFSTDILLSFPEPGLHTAKIVCYMLDCNDIKWDIGCNAEVVVKSYKEKKHTSLMKSTT